MNSFWALSGPFINRTSQVYHLPWDSRQQTLLSLHFYFTSGPLSYYHIFSALTLIYLIFSFHILSTLGTSLEKKSGMNMHTTLTKSWNITFTTLCNFWYIWISICIIIYLHKDVNNWQSLLSWWTERSFILMEGERNPPLSPGNRCDLQKSSQVSSEHLSVTSQTESPSSAG